MAAERPESAKTAEAEKSPTNAQAAAAPAAAPGGFKAWLPLLLNVVLMPVLAYGTINWVLLPKTKSESHAAPPAESHAKAESSGGHGEGGATQVKGKYTAPLGGKVLVNIAGTMGTRYLLANVTLVSSQALLKDLVERNDAELRDVAAGVLASKTIADLEKPGSRNLIRTELLSVFNNVLGEGVVSELYLTEFAIQ